MKFKYHFEPVEGWMNDPNGLCFFGGKYHAFFQYNPYAPKWDTMYWGHAVSEDMINWKQTETALYPLESYENKGGCYSGSALEVDGRLHVFYTSVSHEMGQTQSTACSVDGVHFEKNDQNPIIPRSPYCDEGGYNKDFRDPKVFMAFGRYYMVVGAQTGKEGQVLLYSSEDLERWSFIDVVYATEDFGGTLECPDMFPLGDRWVLMFSAMRPTDASSVFVIGDFDGGRFIPEKRAYVEYGSDFYAPQTFLAPDGRRIIIGWFYHWNKPLPEGADTAGALSIPRELALENGRIIMRPIREARKLFISECPYVKAEGSVLTVFGIDGKEVFSKDIGGINGVERIEKTEILFDEKAVEIFVNGGAVSVAQWLI